MPAQAIVHVVRGGGARTISRICAQFQYLARRGKLELRFSERHGGGVLPYDELREWATRWAAQAGNYINGEPVGDADQAMTTHIIVSFPPGTPRAAAHRAGRAWAEEMFGALHINDVFDYVTAFHVDREHPHLHVVVNRRSLSPGHGWLKIARRNETINYDIMRARLVLCAARENIPLRHDYRVPQPFRPRQQAPLPVREAIEVREYWGGDNQQGNAAGNAPPGPPPAGPRPTREDSPDAPNRSHPPSAPSYGGQNGPPPGVAGPSRWRPGAGGGEPSETLNYELGQVDAEGSARRGHGSNDFVPRSADSLLARQQEAEGAIAEALQQMINSASKKRATTNIAGMLIEFRRKFNGPSAFEAHARSLGVLAGTALQDVSEITATMARSGSNTGDGGDSARLDGSTERNRPSQGTSSHSASQVQEGSSVRPAAANRKPAPPQSDYDSDDLYRDPTPPIAVDRSLPQLHPQSGDGTGEGGLPTTDRSGVDLRRLHEVASQRSQEVRQSQVRRENEVYEEQHDHPARVSSLQSASDPVAILGETLQRRHDESTDGPGGSRSTVPASSSDGSVTTSRIDSVPLTEQEATTPRQHDSSSGSSGGNEPIPTEIGSPRGGEPLVGSDRPMGAEAADQMDLRRPRRDEADSTIQNAPPGAPAVQNANAEDQAVSGPTPETPQERAERLAAARAHRRGDDLDRVVRTRNKRAREEAENEPVSSRTRGAKRNRDTR